MVYNEARFTFLENNAYVLSETGPSDELSAHTKPSNFDGNAEARGIEEIDRWWMWFYESTHHFGEYASASSLVCEIDDDPLGLSGLRMSH